MARGRDLRTVLAGAIICWVVVEGGAVAQEGAEVSEDLGNSYVLARRATAQGSVIETLLFAGQAIVTELAVPARDAGIGAGTTGAVAQASAGRPNQRAETASLPPGIGPGFAGTWLAGEMVGDYLVLHRIRAGEPVTHEIYHEGRKVGLVTEVASATGTARPAARTSFAFESSGDRFTVHKTQPDGTRIQATTQGDRFLGQVVERATAAGAPMRSAVAMPSEPMLGAVRPLAGRTPEPQQLARPPESSGSITVETAVPQIVPTVLEAVPLPRPSPKLRIPLVPTQPLHTASPSAAGNSHRGVSEAITVAPDIRSKPAVTSGDVPRHAPAPRPLATKPAASAAAVPSPAGTVAKRNAASTVAPATRPKPIVTTENAKASSGLPGKSPRPTAPGAPGQ